MVNLFSHRPRQNLRRAGRPDAAGDDPAPAQGESSVTELARPFDMSLPAISKHVRILEGAGILVRRKTGRTFRLPASASPAGRSHPMGRAAPDVLGKELDSLADFPETN